jgi:chromosome segregation ATPase
MADDVENHTLRLLQEIRSEMREGQAEMRSELAEMRSESAEMRGELAATRNELAATRTEMREGFAEVRQRLSIVEGSLGKVIDAVTEIAKIQEKHSSLLIELADSGRIAGTRLNALEARLGRIESKTGLALQ